MHKNTNIKENTITKQIRIRFFLQSQSQNQKALQLGTVSKATFVWVELSSKQRTKP